MIKKKIKKLRQLIKLINLDGYIIPKNDEFFSEYAFPNRLKTISNFSGSAGFAIVMKDKNYLFVDGRYVIQAKIESGKQFNILEIPKIFPSNIFIKNNKTMKIGFDPNLFTKSTLKKYFDNTCDLVPINNNLIDEIYCEKTNIKNNYFYNLDYKITGETIKSKLDKIYNTLGKNKVDNLFISAPENVAWLLNLRGKDNPNSPN